MGGGQGRRAAGRAARRRWPAGEPAGRRNAVGLRAVRDPARPLGAGERLPSPGQRWGINQLDGRTTEPYDPNAVIPNPARRRLDRNVRLARVTAGLARNELAALRRAGDARRGRWDATLERAVAREQRAARAATRARRRTRRCARRSWPTSSCATPARTRWPWTRCASPARTPSRTWPRTWPRRMVLPGEAKKLLANVLRAPGHVVAGKSVITVRRRAKDHRGVAPGRAVGPRRRRRERLHQHRRRRGRSRRRRCDPALPEVRLRRRARDARREAQSPDVPHRRRRARVLDRGRLGGEGLRRRRSRRVREVRVRRRRTFCRRAPIPPERDRHRRGVRLLEHLRRHDEPRDHPARADGGALAAPASEVPVLLEKQPAFQSAITASTKSHCWFQPPIRPAGKTIVKRSRRVRSQCSQTYLVRMDRSI